MQPSLEIKLITLFKKLEIVLKGTQNQAEIQLSLDEIVEQAINLAEIDLKIQNR